MSKKIKPGEKGRIPHLLRCAFKEAEAGDTQAALAYWNQAVSEGYHGSPKNFRSLKYVLVKAGASLAELDD